MSATIHKFTISVADEATIPMPKGASVIHVGHQTSGITLWAVVDTASPIEHRTFHIRGTGHPLGKVGEHLGTCIIGPFVWHVFDGARA